MEARLGWHRAIAASKHYHTTVICSELSSDGIAEYEAEHGPTPNLDFQIVRFEPKQINNSFVMSYRSFYRDYHRWQRGVYELAKKLHARDPFCLTHQVGICGFREPGYLWKLDAPFVWGPFGGTQNYPFAFLGQLGFREAVLEVSRAIVNNWHLRFRPRVRSAVSHAARIYAANSQNQLDFLRVHGRMPALQLETGLAELPQVSLSKRSDDAPLRILWAGRFKPWKALPLLLNALKGLDRQIPFQVRVIGHQTSEAEYRRLVKRLGLESNVTWLGWPEYQDSLVHYEWADVFAFTSLRDTSGTGLLEALAHGCPIVGVNHQGARDIMTDDCSIPIDVTTPRKVVYQFRQAILDLARNPDMLLRKSRAALRRAEDFTWEVLGEQMVEDYGNVASRKPS